MIITTKQNAEAHIKLTIQLCADFMTAKVLNGPNPDNDEISDMNVKWFQIGQYCLSLLDFKSKRNTPKRIKHDINLTLMYVTELDSTLDFFDTKNEIIGIDYLTHLNQRKKSYDFKDSICFLILLNSIFKMDTLFYLS